MIPRLLRGTTNRIARYSYTHGIVRMVLSGSHAGACLQIVDSMVRCHTPA